MDISSICRTCLSSSSLEPIFHDEEDFIKCSEYISEATGVQIQHNDSLPQNMCTKCIAQLNDTIKFRKQCKATETHLLEAEKGIKVIKRTLKKTDLRFKVTRNIVSKNYTILKEAIMKPSLVNCDKPLQNIISLGYRTELQKNNHPKTKTANETLNDDYIINTTETFSEEFNSIPKSFEDVTNINTDNVASSYVPLIQTTNTEINPTEILQYNDTSTDLNDEILEDEHSDNEDIFNDNQTTQVYEAKDIEAPYIIKDCTTEKTTRVICKICQAELSIRSIDSHMSRRHPGADGRKVKCDQCDSYVLKEKLNRHQLMMHVKGRLECGFCLTPFESKESLVQHVSACTEKKKKQKVNNQAGRELSECDVCNKTMQKASIRMHKLIKHAGLRPVCEHCGKAFGSKFRLNEHCRAKHGYEKFQCSYCEFQSASVMAMRNHERRHRGEKPYVCETCGAKFHAAYLLAQHKHSHNTEKSVKCEQCPATFKANNSLHMHRLTCHSTSLYKCSVCCRSYSCRYYAIKHLRHVHRYIGNSPPIQKMPKE